MTNVSIHPSTLDGIKGLAKLIKREQGVSHTMALSQAARAAGYENFHHARRHLARPARAPVGRQLYDLYLTAYWRDGDASGRETLRVQLTESLKSLVPPSLARSFSKYFRIDAEDHLETRDDIRDQAAARKGLVKRFAEWHVDGLKVRHPSVPFGFWQGCKQPVLLRVGNGGHNSPHRSPSWILVPAYSRSRRISYEAALQHGHAQLHGLRPGVCADVQSWC